jgi:hypothetical protein
MYVYMYVHVCISVSLDLFLYGTLTNTISQEAQQVPHSVSEGDTAPAVYTKANMIIHTSTGRICWQ